MTKNNKPEGLALPEGARIGPNCGVTAMAIAAGISFDSAWDLLERVDRRSKKFTGATFDADRERAYKKLGLKTTKINWKDRYDIAKKKGNLNLTLRNFVEWGTAKGKTYIVTTTGHVQVVKDGWVIDQGGAKPIEEFHGKAKHIDSIHEVGKIRKASKNHKYENKVFYAKDTNMKNPRKQKTFGYHSMEIILNNPGCDYEFYIKQGGRSNDLAWDIKKGNIVVKEKGTGNGGYFKRGEI